MKKMKKLTSFGNSKMRNLKIALMLSVVFSCFLLVSSNGEAEILIRVKKTRLDDPHGKLSNWVIKGGDGRSPCNWTGIACDPRNGTVLGIDLSGFGLYGEFPYGFCRIRTLRNLTLGQNYLNGTISSSSLSLCSRLEVLILSENYFDGKLPEFSPEFVNLRVLELKSNNFVGEIPASYDWFPVLEVLNLGGNLLDGTIPEFIGNLTELNRLELGYNPFMPGPIPSSIGNLTKLNYLWLSHAYLIGEIPETIGNLVALTALDLTGNSLTGKIPSTIRGLRSIERIFLYENSLSGELPETIGNLSTLIDFDVSENNLSGEIPTKIAALKLSSFNLNDNFFTGEIPEIVATNPNLYQFKIFNNSFSGKLPLDLGRFSDLEDFDCSSNNLIGELPPFLCYRNRLQRLVAFGNGLSGSIPEAYGLCDTLNYVRIENNLFSGKVPIGFWGLPELDMLQMSDNRLEGSISPTIYHARNLSHLLISGNKFSGDIPIELCDLHNLILLDLSRNRLSGSIRHCITDLKKLQKLDMQENLLTGPIPSSVSSWTGLTELNLSHNLLSGEIPSDLGELPVLTYLDLSSNSISGEIPANLAKLKLNQFNVSNNRLYGRIPIEFQNAFFKSSLLGNPGLCAPDLDPIPPCRSKHEALLLAAVIVICVAVLIASCVCFFLKTKPLLSFTKSNRRYKVTLFQRVGFTEKDIFPQLTEENVIGSGGSGRVYKVSLKSGQVFAVKKLWGSGGATTKRDLEAAFFSEVETLGRVRHRNIVKLVMCCRGEDHRILVYEFMENGSLGDVLHGEKGFPAVPNLDWTARHAIAVGAAQGLAYLHHDCVPAIVHRDVKSNNILLDAEMKPRVADFGLAKSLGKDGNGVDAAAMSRIAGSYGYIAPEYAYTLQVNEKTDVYSFGVVLLELITGKRPNDPCFGENKDIVKFVMEAVLSSSPRDVNYDCARHRFRGLKELVDPRMKPSASDFEGIEKVLDVALLCTSSFPINRPSMRKVVELL